MKDLFDDLYEDLMNESDIFLNTGLTLDDEDGFYSEEEDEPVSTTASSGPPSFPEYKGYEELPEPEPKEDILRQATPFETFQMADIGEDIESTIKELPANIVSGMQSGVVAGTSKVLHSVFDRAADVKVGLSQVKSVSPIAYNILSNSETFGKIYNAVYENSPVPYLAEVAQGASEYWDDQAQKSSPDKDKTFSRNPISKTVGIIARSLPLTIFAVASSILGKNPAIGLTMFGLSSYGDKYTESQKDLKAGKKGILTDAARAAGMSDREISDVMASLQAAVTVGTESISLGKILGNKGISKIRDALSTGSVGSLQEVSEQFGSNLVTKFGSDKAIKIHKDFVEAAIGGLGGEAAMGSIVGQSNLTQLEEQLTGDFERKGVTHNEAVAMAKDIIKLTKEKESADVLDLIKGVLKSGESGELFKNKRSKKPNTLKEKESSFGLPKDALNKLNQVKQKVVADKKKPFSVYQAGKKEGTKLEKEKSTLQKQKILEDADKKISKVNTAKEIIQKRRQRIRAIREALGLSDADMRKINKKDIRIMDDYEFKKFKDDLSVRASQLAVSKQKKHEITDLISKKNLTKTDNMRAAIKLPSLNNMTDKQLDTFSSILDQYETGDEFLTKRQIETVDRTELKGIRTIREARVQFAKKLGVSVDSLSNIKTTEFDDYRWDSSLAQQNPFYKMMVDLTTQSTLAGEKEYLDIEKQTYKLAAAANKSRPGSIVKTLIPQQKLIIKYLESTVDQKEAIREQMTGAELDYAHFIEQNFQQSLDYLIDNKILDAGLENYFTHIRMGTLESLKENGLVKTVVNAFNNHKLDQVGFNILDGDTGNILSLDKFFKFSLRRTGAINPSQNVTKSFLAYMKTLKKKQSLDKVIPQIEIFASALTPKRATKKGLTMDRGLKTFVKKWLNNKKGRRDKFLKQNGEIDMALRFGNTIVSMIDLAGSVPVGLASVIGEQTMTYVSTGSRAYAKGVVRSQTKKGKRITEKYTNLIGKSIWGELIEADKDAGERLMQGLYGFFHQSSVMANSVHLLGTMTQQEWESETVSDERLADIKTDMGRWRDINGTDSIAGSTSAGKTLTKYKGWAIPIMSTALKNVIAIGKKVKNEGFKKGFTSKEAGELNRAFIQVAVVLGLGIKFIDEDDNSFLGKLKAKIYREGMTFLSGISPRTFTSMPRLLTFLNDFVTNISMITQTYKTNTKNHDEGDNVGVNKLKKQFTPGAIKQFQGDSKSDNPFDKVHKKSQSSSSGNPFDKVKQ